MERTRNFGLGLLASIEEEPPGKASLADGLETSLLFLSILFSPQSYASEAGAP
jgi:hypothetical protein